ncbi:hypothetical protein [Kitasatospora purpeofusca]|nr:hypothetical protein OIP63_36090 [Kitasatospora purpeofusca]
MTKAQTLGAPSDAAPLPPAAHDGRGRALAAVPSPLPEGALK